MFLDWQQGRSWGLTFAVLAVLSFLATAAEARVGGGSSSGSRGSRTYSSPPATSTAPKAAPIEKSSTQPGKSTLTAQAPLGGPSRFGWRSIVLGGLFAGVFASLFGFGALASLLGFLLQAGLVVGLVWLVLNYFRSRRLQPATATAGMNASRSTRRPMDYGTGTNSGAATGPEIGPQDYDAFERLLGEIQLAYGQRDERVLGPRATPEMLSYFLNELEADSRKGLRNEISSPKLLQGDLAEAWRDGSEEYATVAMRFTLIDATVDSAGRIVSGSRTAPQEVTELWTFRRPHGGSANQWELSAIQQAAPAFPIAS